MATLPVEQMLPTKFQPIAKRNFIFAIEGIDYFLIKTASKPTIQTEEVAINWMNSQRKVAGKTTFGTISVTMMEAIAPSAAQQVEEWRRLVHEQVSGRGGYADFYKRDIQIKVTDPVGNIIQQWELKGAFPTEVNYGELNYEGSDLGEITVQIAFDTFCLSF